MFFFLVYSEHSPKLIEDRAIEIQTSLVHEVIVGYEPEKA